MAVRCNVAHEVEAVAIVLQRVTAFGRLDAAYNNAGAILTLPGPLTPPS